jgi:hypothetical protein
MVDTTRRDKIRAEVAAHRVTTIRLRDEIVDVSKKDRLLLVLHFLDDVNRYFLDSVDRNLTAPQESEWLGHADTLLHIALKILHDVDNNVQNYGDPDHVRTV